MKPLTLALSAAMLTALAASAAQAGTRHHVRHHYGAYAYRGYGPINAGGVYAPGPIYRQGYYLGTDPDPNVRFEITRDPYFGRK